MLGINEPPVTIKVIERAIVDRAFDEGWIHPEPPSVRTGKRVAVVGSGPAGLAAAQQLARAGHWVTVYEKADRIGGLLRYGIPNFKMEKHLIDRRLEQMHAEGVEFVTNAHVGVNVPVRADLRRDLRCHPARRRRRAAARSPVPGRELNGIHFAMEFLPQQNRLSEGDKVPIEASSPPANASSSSAAAIPAPIASGTSHRQKARSPSISSNSCRSRPTSVRHPLPGRSGPCNSASKARTKRVATANGASPPRFTGDEHGNVKKLHGVRVGPPRNSSHPGHRIHHGCRPGSAGHGLPRPRQSGMIEQLGVDLDPRGNVAADDDYMTSVPGVFAAGDMRRGQSLVVWAIAEGRKAAAAMDVWLNVT